MRWLVADSLYCRESFFCSHLDSYSHYLREYGEAVDSLCLNYPGLGVGPLARPDVAFVLDRYEDVNDARATVNIAQVAAITDVLPWEVRKPDGSPAYDCVISSLRWMVEEARKHGCRAEYMPLAFDTRARVCGMGVERDLGCIFVGTVGPNHQKRARLLEELRDVVTVFPPTFGRDYFRLLARATSVLNVHAEWARGERNNMRVFETCGMGAECITDGESSELLPGSHCETAMGARTLIARVNAYGATRMDLDQDDHALTLASHTYESRIPRLVEIARECMEAKR